MLDLPPAAQCVVLLHGLGRSAFSMNALARDFRAAGFVVVNQGYPSRAKTLPKLAQYVTHAVQKCAERAPIHFVTHSMGAIVLRQYFADTEKLGAINTVNFGRAVLLGPPNHGSEIVDAWGKRWWYRLALGPAGAALSTAANSSPNMLPSLPIKFAVVAGDSATQNWFLPAVSLPGDGKVSVASTHLDGMDALQRVAVGHTWLPGNRAVRKLALNYIQTGKF